jgi:4-amino-4-deoxy-L-arabinose transferase-like glycosyltransferase
MPKADPESTPADKNTLWTYVFFLGVGAIAIALRTPELSSKGLWLDEAYSVMTARLPFMEMLENLNRDATPPLYYLSLAPWIQLFGSGEAAVRALSLVFSVGGIALTGWMAYRHFSLRIASVVTMALAFTPMHVYYAQEARMYSLLALLGVALVFASLEYLTRGTRLALMLAALCSLLMLLTHNIAAWFVIGVNVAFLAFCDDRKLWTRWLAAQSIVGLCYLPSLLLAVQQAHEQGDVLAWFLRYWNAKSEPPFDCAVPAQRRAVVDVLWIVPVAPIHQRSLRRGDILRRVRPESGLLGRLPARAHPGSHGSSIPPVVHPAAVTRNRQSETPVPGRRRAGRCDGRLTRDSSDLSRLSSKESKQRLPVGASSQSDSG